MKMRRKPNEALTNLGRVFGRLLGRGASRCSTVRFGNPLVLFGALTMDPKACIEAAQWFLRGGDPIEALDRILNYYHWRARGGFEPYPGADETVSILSAQTLDALQGD